MEANQNTAFDKRIVSKQKHKNTKTQARQAVWVNMGLGLFTKKKKTSESFVFKKCCDWIIFFQVFLFQWLHCKELFLKEKQSLDEVFVISGIIIKVEGGVIS